MVYAQWISRTSFHHDSQLLKCHISHTIDRTLKTCDIASSLTGLQPTGRLIQGEFHMKFLVYVTPVDLAENLVTKIVVAVDKISTTFGIFERVRQSFLLRCQLCNDTHDQHSENLL